MKHRRLYIALAAYVAIAMAAYFLLTGQALLIVLTLLFLFTARTLVAHFRPQD